MLPPGVSSIELLKQKTESMGTFCGWYYPQSCSFSVLCIYLWNSYVALFFIVKFFCSEQEHVEGYLELSAKTKTYFATAAALWDADFYVKVDDDVHVNIGTYTPFSSPFSFFFLS